MPQSDKTSVPDSTVAESTRNRSSKLNKLKFGSLASTVRDAFYSNKSHSESAVPDQKAQAAANSFLTMAAESRVTANETHDGGQSAIGPDTTSPAKSTTVTQPPIEEDDMEIRPAPPRY